MDERFIYVYCQYELRHYLTVYSNFVWHILVRLIFCITKWCVLFFFLHFHVHSKHVNLSSGCTSKSFLMFFFVKFGTLLSKEASGFISRSSERFPSDDVNSSSSLYCLCFVYLHIYRSRAISGVMCALLFIGLRSYPGVSAGFPF